MSNPEMQKIIGEIERIILQWDETSAGAGDFGARAFLVQQKEFGHIHRNGDLDIVFGKTITKALLEKRLVKMHSYVPEVGITYTVSSEEDVPFSVSLLRFSYLIHFIKSNGNNAASQNIFKSEFAKLPESLSSILPEMKMM